MKILSVVLLEFVSILITNAYVNNFNYGDNTAYGYIRRFGRPLAKMIWESEILAHRISDDDYSEENEIEQNGDRLSARKANFPYQVGLIGNYQGEISACGGSLISASKVLTAAHCWFDGETKIQSFTVVLGSMTLSSGGVRLNTSHVTMHKKWNPRKRRNDIAVVHLPQTVQFSKTISPIPLPRGNEVKNQFVDVTAIATGFSQPKEGELSSSPSYLHHVKLKIISDAECRKVFPLLFDSVMCAKSCEHQNICVGYSGGPLVVTKGSQNILVGVSSFVFDSNCYGGSPAGFTMVNSYIKWIHQFL